MRQVLRPVLLLSASSVVVALSAVVRQKVVADLLGAPGVGTLGLMTAFTAVAATLLGLGVGTSGVPVISSARDREDTRRRARDLLLLSGALAALGFVVVGLATGSGELTGIGDPTWQVRLAMAATVASTILQAGQMAFLNGTGRLSVMALCNGLGAVAGTVASVLGLYLFGYAGLAVALVGAPAATALLAQVFVTRDYRRLPHQAVGPGLETGSHLKRMALLGSVVMASLVIGVAAQLAARLVIKADLGLEGVGYYQASWSISTMYLSFLLTALAAEYFPRISKHTGDRERVRKALDDQIVLTVALAAPLIAWGITLAPAILHLLYAPEFVEATELLRWHLAADVFKLPAWAVGFLLLAADRRLLFFVAELAWNVVFLVLLVLLSREWGLVGAGVATFCAYGVYLAVCLTMARRLVSYRPTPLSGGVFGMSSAAMGIQLLSVYHAGDSARWLLPIVSTVLTVVMALTAYTQVRSRRASPPDHGRDVRHPEGGSA